MWYSTTATPEEDLRWYFGGEAEAELGVRSVQAGFEATMQRMALCGPAESGQVPARETRQGAPDLEVTERQLDAAERCNKIHARLAAITPRQRVVLQLHFGSAVEVDGAGIDLVCQSDLLSAAVARINARRDKHGRSPLDRRAVLLRMAVDASDAAALADVVQDARRALHGALAAYGRQAL